MQVQGRRLQVERMRAGGPMGQAGNFRFGELGWGTRRLRCHVVHVLPCLSACSSFGMAVKAQSDSCIWETGCCRGCCAALCSAVLGWTGRGAERYVAHGISQ